MIRILLVREFKQIQGIEKTVLSFAHGLDPREFETWIACSDEADPEFYRILKEEKIYYSKVRLRNIKGSWGLFQLIEFFLNTFFLFFQIMRLIRKHSIGMIQVHSLSECLQMIPVTFLKRIPLIWVVQEWFPFGRVRRILFSFLSKFIFRLLPVSHFVMRNLQGLGIPSNKMMRIPMGISVKVASPLEDPAFRKISGPSSNQRRVAVLIPGMKRHMLESFIQAVRLVRMEFEHVEFWLAASKSCDTGELKKKILQWSPMIQRVGSFQEIPEGMSGIDIFIYLGVKEPFPFEIKEAMAAQVAVIANRSGAVPEIVVDRKTGILVQPQDARQLAKAVIELLSDHPLREQMCREGRKRIEEMFRTEDQIRAVRAVYHLAQTRVRQLSAS